MTPTNSDRLREITEFYATDVEAAKEWHSFPPTKEGDVVFLLSEIDKLNAEKAATIEVLEALLGFPHQWCRAEAGDMPPSPCTCGKYLRDALAKPLLDKLKGES